MAGKGAQQGLTEFSPSWTQSPSKKRIGLFSRFLGGEPEEDVFLPPVAIEVEQRVSEGNQTSSTLPSDSPSVKPTAFFAKLKSLSFTNFASTPPENTLPNEEIDPDEESDGEVEPPTDDNSPTKNLAPIATLSTRQFWMPDEECKFCYDCQIPFSTFKRKHHCRICGQVFCWKCSHNEIKMANKAPIRTCNSCYKATLKLGTPQGFDSMVKRKSFESGKAQEPTNSPSIPHNPFLKLKSIFPDSDVKSPDGDGNQPEESSQSDDSNQTGEGESSDQSPKANPDVLSLKEHPRYVRKSRTLDRMPHPAEANRVVQEHKQDPATAAKRALGQASESHLVAFVKQLIQSENLSPTWIETILKFARRACENVKPWVREGDKMDIREYVKVKIIPEGLPSECQYVDGVVFSKNLAHKKMKFEIPNPRILLLDCSLEFQRENRLLLLEDLLSQERSYLKLLVARIAALKPDLLLVGRTVSRLAQEFLLEANIPFALNIKQVVIKRLARATGADILTSATDHVLNPVLGGASKFYVRTFKYSNTSQPFMFIDGCPPNLGCTIILRGDSKETLKRLKRVTLFATYIAYNLHIEKQLLFDEYCTVSPGSAPEPAVILSCSPNVRFPAPTAPNGPPSLYLPSNKDEDTNIAFNEPEDEEIVNPFAVVADYQFDRQQLKESAESTSGDDLKKNGQYVDVGMKANPYDHQKLLYLHSLCCVTTSKQCIPYEVHLMDYYSESDVTLGEFLEEFCFNPSHRCKVRDCNRDMTEHERTFAHGNGRLNISVGKADAQLKFDTAWVADSILIWNFCKICSTVTPFVPMSQDAWNYSFGKFLELSFHCFSPVSRLPSCGHSMHRDHIRYFFWNNLIAEFEFEQIDILEVVVPPLCEAVYPKKNELIMEKDLQLLSTTAQQVYNAILKKLNQMEIRQKGATSQKMQQLIQTYKNERGLFFEELQLLQNGDASHLNKLKRILYINAITWNSTLESTKEADSIEKLSTQELRVANGSPAVQEGVLDPKTAKPSLFTAITSLLSSGHASNSSTPQPLFLPPGVNDSVIVVYEDESSSLIAYALSSLEYSQQYDALWKGEDVEMGDKSNNEDPLAKNLVSRKRGDIVNKFEYEKGSYKVRMSCTSFYAKQFHALRSFCCGEENFIRSLSRSKSWDARGGKSKATWAKTFDDRFVLKEISKLELESLLEVAPLYFEYLSNALFQQVPTILAKIFGVFKVRFKNANGKDVAQNLVVMENLFHSRSSTVTKIYDLKGSKRSRYVHNPMQNEVLLDENLLEVMFTSPIWVDENSKTTLQAAIWNDSLFLSSLSVMDYSLVVGIDSTNKQFIVGIIDYIRKYTWDKQFETLWKSTGIAGGRGKIPTIISPKQYKVRFREAMNLYFVRVPNKNTDFRLKRQS